MDVVVGTPGRVLDHIDRATLRLGDVRTVVLDEADEMLDMGFAEDIEAILGRDPRRAADGAVLARRCRPGSTASPAATCAIRSGSRWAARPSAPGELPLVRQSAYVVARAHKPAALGRILDVEAPTAAIVFCRTREEVDQVTETLNGRGYRAEALHGGMSQDQRDRVMGRLRGGSTELLVATDVAARGLDVEQLTHVINYNVPAAPEAYVHRIGRVGRAGREGAAITLAEPREQRMLKAIERLTGQRITVEKLPTVTDLRARRLELTRDGAAGQPGGRRPGTVPGRDRVADRRVRHRERRAGRGEAAARGGRRRRRRGGDPVGRRPRAGSARDRGDRDDRRGRRRSGRARSPDAGRDPAVLRPRPARRAAPAGPGRRDRRRVRA